jgi:fibro-slime domain-containing protein
MSQCERGSFARSAGLLPVALLAVTGGCLGNRTSLRVPATSGAPDAAAIEVRGTTDAADRGLTAPGAGGVPGSGGIAVGSGGAAGLAGGPGLGGGGATGLGGTSLTSICGDQVISGNETCDDGNTMPFDGCSADCRKEPACGAGRPCTSTCGDGFVIDEACDDGNTRDGDGCSASCRVESGWTCAQPALGAKLLVPAVYRDFRFHHPSDFEPGVIGQQDASPGMVESDLDSDGKPVFTGITGNGVHVESPSSFATWYRDVTGVNHTTVGSLAMWTSGSGYYVNRYGPNGEQWDQTQDGNPFFFPVDGDTFTPASEFGPAQAPPDYDTTRTWPYDLDSSGHERLHNFSFTSELHHWLKYDARNPVTLTILVDDDGWVFIHGKLAIDVGGIHMPVTRSLTVDATAAAALGLVDGGVYEIAVFQAERQTTSSTLSLTLPGFNTAPSQCRRQ